jgi:hypothetical protein
LKLAHFLHERGLLTDGGALNLGQGLSGRGEVLSLTTQDVRASAHSLTRDLLKAVDPSCWPGLAEDYYKRYDRGKPRRPTRLQRLFLEWSADLGPLGMLEACQTHPRLWQAIDAALPPNDHEDPDCRLLSLALKVRESEDWETWLEAFASDRAIRAELLALLPLLPYPAWEVRLAWLADQAAGPHAPWSEELLTACRRRPGSPAVAMPEPLIALTIRLVVGAPGEVDPRWLAALRTFRWPASSLTTLANALSLEDPVHRIVYGARPGKRWLADLWDELERLSQRHC